MNIISIITWDYYRSSVHGNIPAPAKTKNKGSGVFAQ